jgi:predicted nucleic-acid-binding protein
VIGVDTNVLLRFFVKDDLAQFRVSEAILNAPERIDDPLLVSPIVLVEIEWVLRRVYSQEKSAILAVLQQITTHAHIFVDDREAIEAAIAAWRKGAADFADYLIGAIARERGARTTVTFDRAAAETVAFSLLRI